jgi:hypothetical protein
LVKKFFFNKGKISSNYFFVFLKFGTAEKSRELKSTF